MDRSSCRRRRGGWRRDRWPPAAHDGPASARATALAAATVVLPTPPLPVNSTNRVLATAQSRAGMLASNVPRTSSVCRLGGRGARDPSIRVDESSVSSVPWGAHTGQEVLVMHDSQHPIHIQVQEHYAAAAKVGGVRRRGVLRRRRHTVGRRPLRRPHRRTRRGGVGQLRLRQPDRGGRPARGGDGARPRRRAVASTCCCLLDASARRDTSTAST